MKAIYLTKDNDQFAARVADIDEARLPEGDVTLAVEYSTLNYKDALAIANKSPVVRKWPMVAQQVEELICLVSAMDRPALARHFRAFRGNFPVDFTDQFLETAPLDRLRHIFVALCLQSQHVPEVAEDTPQAA